MSNDQGMTNAQCREEEGEEVKVAGVIALTAVALVLLPSNIYFFVRHAHRVNELSGMRLWSFVVMLIAIGGTTLWSVGMIGAVLFMGVRWLARRVSSELDSSSE